MPLPVRGGVARRGSRGGARSAPGHQADAGPGGRSSGGR